MIGGSDICGNTRHTKRDFSVQVPTTTEKRSSTGEIQAGIWSLKREYSSGHTQHRVVNTTVFNQQRNSDKHRERDAQQIIMIATKTANKDEAEWKGGRVV